MIYSNKISSLFSSFDKFGMLKMSELVELIIASTVQ